MSEMITIEAEVNGYINKGISAVQINDAGELVMLLTDGSIINLGCVKGEKGESAELPVFVLTWHNGIDFSGIEHPTEEEKQANIDAIKQISAVGVHNCIVYLKAPREDILLTTVMSNGTEFIFDSNDEYNYYPVYSIAYDSSNGRYSQTFTNAVTGTIKLEDEIYDKPATAGAVIDYVNSHLTIDSEVLV